MRFLCLHGQGTNSNVLEAQLATIRYELGDHHQYEYAEGTIKSTMAPDLLGIFSPDDEYFDYFDPTQIPSCTKALENLQRFVEVEGPFDGVIAFSQGAMLASTFIIQQSRQSHTASPPFRCAIFFSGGQPCDPILLDLGVIRLMKAPDDKEVLDLPVATIWGEKDRISGYGELDRLCVSGKRTSFIHEGGHEIPGSGMKDAVTGCVNAMRRVIDQAYIN